MKTARLIVAGLLAAAPFAASAAQSKPQTREGFTIALGIGSGSAGLSCDFCGGADRISEPSGFLRIGGTVRPNLVVAAHMSGWTHEVDATTTSTIGFLFADALYYPKPETGWYVESGLGLGQYKNSDSQSGNELTSSGLALNLGTGYDIRVAKNFSLTPYVNWSGTAGAKAKQDGSGTGSKLNVNLFQIGLGFTWH